MLIAARNGFLAGKNSILPPGARWVEFLESTGTQWIDTGITYDTDYTYQMAFRCQFTPGLTGYYNYVAGWGAGGAFGGGSSTAWTDGQSANNGGGSCVLVTDVTMTINAGLNSTTVTSFVPGKTVTRNTHSNLPNYTNGGIPIFAAYIPNVTPCSNVRFYKASISVNSALVRDLIPVRVGSGANAVGYMYDRVTRKLFGNAGTGDFVIGPDTNAPAS